MKVFGFPLSPFVRKVHLVAAEKGVAVEAVPANPRSPSDEFAAASPFRKIPALQDGDFTLADSTAIVTYIDALHPQPAIFPAEPRARGKAIWWEEFADTILAAASGKVVFNRFVAPKVLGVPGDEQAAEEGVGDVLKLADWFESQVPETGWLCGEFSIADIAVATVFRTLGYVGLEPGADRHPRTAAWYGRVTARPAWQAVAAAESQALAAFAA
ncbi:MAG: glutathione S-transferase family protein [Novosphingobium sp.]